MAIRFGLADAGLLRERAISASGAGIWWRSIPLPIKFGIVVLLSLMLLVMSVLSTARTGVVPEINILAETYLPGNAIPKDAECFDLEYLYRSCIISVLGQKI